MPETNTGNNNSGYLQRMAKAHTNPNDAIELSSYYVPDGKQDVVKVYNDSYSNQEQIFPEDQLRVKKPFFKNLADSFKRVEPPKLDPTLSDMERSNILASHSQLKRRLHGRHLQMIAIGGAIGSGLFVGSGTALRHGGPASVLISWILSGSMMYCTTQALGEMAVAFPVSGCYVQYNSRFLSPALGFAMAWNYTLNWFVSLPLELVSASITIKFWNKDINAAAWVSIFYFAVVFINLFGVRGYGEVEFCLSLIKVLTIIGFIILAIIMDCGGVPTSKEGYIGTKNDWFNCCRNCQS
ncbi:unnamed protein product [Ambrosiozyma monospora]|uniref:Unnamed protein product n=1 Tax=Ambrosiozyma monospora TaxID=43982 RepID=A0ACB5T0P1_AMBMO|nr:unnamed protein product [Ambrosiozyma monospora]